VSYRWGGSLYSTGHAAALACCADWILGRGSKPNAITALLVGFDPAALATECVNAWHLARPGGRDPSPDDGATSLLDDWGLSPEDMDECMREAFAEIMRQAADDIANG
jgi:hypothetical protein